jgi:hypothetical protein
MHIGRGWVASGDAVIIGQTREVGGRDVRGLMRDWGEEMRDE